MSLQAYRVVALWGPSSEDGDYTAWAWAEDPAQAARQCIEEMQAEYGEDTEYEVVSVDPMADYIGQEQQALDAMREFLTRRPNDT
jgi:hypothetical protein